MEKNNWFARFKKFLIAALAGIVAIANATADGPSWIYPAAGIASAILVAITGNAPKYKSGQNELK